MSFQNRVTGFHLGIVIQNDDPEKRGRVKVFVPHLSANVYENWNKDFKELDDKQFTFVDKDKNPDLDKILPTLKKILPWAEQASPLFGGNASGRYNAFTKTGTTSDSNFWDGDTYKEGMRPLQNYTGENKVSDAFTASNNSFNGLVNPNAGQYVPSDYSNLARGLFTIPNVGAHVLVIFLDGDPNYPMILASIYGQDDWKRMYTTKKETEAQKDFVATDYPGAFENLSTDDSVRSITHDDKTFRSKHVFNSNKNTIEMVDTDLMELLKFTHYSGSFLEFNNKTTSRFASTNDQLLVLGDQFTTVRKNQALFVSNTQQNTIHGDRFNYVGDFNAKAKVAKDILSILKDTHDYKMLFEVQRTDANDFTSSLQLKAGTPAICPVCQGAGMKFGKPCITCGGSGESPSSQWGIWMPDPTKWEPVVPIMTKEWDGKKSFTDKQYQATLEAAMIYANQQKISKLEALFGNGGDDNDIITGNRTINIGTVFNDLQSYRIDYKGKIRNGGVFIATKGVYVSMKECPLIEYVDVANVPGGDYLLNVGNRYRLNVGSKGIQMKTTGPLDIYGAILNICGEAVNISAKQELLIDGGKHTEIRGDIITLKPSEGGSKQILMDGNVGVANNLTVVGGVHSEGMLTYINSTARRTPYMTDVGFGPVPHTHVFYGPPWTLLETTDAVRDYAAQNNVAKPAPNLIDPDSQWNPM